MKRLFSTYGVGVFVFAIMCIGSGTRASAQLVFDDPVTFNLSTLNGVLDPASGIVGAGLSDVSTVTLLDFLGRIAINGTDSDGTPGVSTGDTSIVVGHAIHDGGTIGGVGGTLNSNTAGTEFEFTAIVRDWTGTITFTPGIIPIITTFYDDAVVVGGGPLGGIPGAGSTGIIDLYVNFGLTPGFTQDHLIEDVNTSDNGIWVASFAIDSSVQVQGGPILPQSTFVPGLVAGTNVGLRLISVLGGGGAGTDFIQTDGGLDLLGGPLGLASFVTSVDTSILQDGTAAKDLVGIFGAAGDPVSVGAVPPVKSDPAVSMPGAAGVFAPATVGTPAISYDLISKFDSNATFAIIPEPSSITLFSMALLGLGFAGLKRRRQKKNAS